MLKQVTAVVGGHQLQGGAAESYVLKQGNGSQASRWAGVVHIVALDENEASLVASGRGGG